MFSIKDYIIATLAAAIISLQLFTSLEISGLEKTLLSSQLEVAESRMVSSTYENIVKSNNTRIVALGAMLTTKRAELAKWEDTPVEVRYETVYKHIATDINMTKDDCETTKKVIDAVRITDFDGI